MGVAEFLLLAGATGAVVWTVLAYNRLVALRARMANGFAQIDVQMKRRLDLVPNLVEVARKYMEHERSTLEAVIVARNQAYHAVRDAARQPGDLHAMQTLSAAAGQLAESLGRLMAVVEAYPALKADATMRQLSEELSSTENRVAFARQAYNDAVMEYNVGIGQFPANLVAGAFRFMPSQTLQATETAAERQPIRVSF
jgi:LemA protein